jgi:methylmalonyl-CoA mutase N-terminal domain/subunit
MVNDEALSLPTEEAAELPCVHNKLLRMKVVQLTLADALDGSFFVEKLTNEVEKKAWQ